MTQPSFFPDAASFRRWLEANAATAEELSVGFRKKATGQPSVTRAEARDEALCFGWIDGVRHRIDDDKPETRARRLAALIEDSAAGRKIASVDIESAIEGGQASAPILHSRGIRAASGRARGEAHILR